jgi:hypothetical protein
MAQAAANFALKQVSSVLENISEYFYENETMCAFWNDWEGRDARARQERSYNNGRFSYEKKTWGFANGRWYCCLKFNTAKERGLLD